MTKIYLADADRLADPEVFEKLYRVLPAHRKEKIDRSRFEKNKRLCMAAWLVLMYALEQEGVDHRDIRLSFGEYGKPYLTDYPELFFNLSHSGNRVMCGVSDREVGCDVQQIKTYDSKLAERFFCPEECQHIAAAGSEERDVLFFRYWTLKESFIKNLGRGLSLPLQEFCISLKGDRPVVSQQVLPAESFFFREFELDDGYRYACCSRSTEIADAQIVNCAEIIKG